jgi:hypothetical protein
MPSPSLFPLLPPPPSFRSKSRSRSPHPFDGSLVPFRYRYLNDANGDVERARGALDLLLEIEECMKGNKKERSRSRCRSADRTECVVMNSEARATQKDGMRECRVYRDRFSSVALSCHREIVPEVILYIIMFIATINIILVRFINRPRGFINRHPTHRARLPQRGRS